MYSYLKLVSYIFNFVAKNIILQKILRVKYYYRFLAKLDHVLYSGTEGVVKNTCKAIQVRAEVPEKYNGHLMFRKKT